MNSPTNRNSKYPSIARNKSLYANGGYFAAFDNSNPKISGFSNPHPKSFKFEAARNESPLSHAMKNKSRRNVDAPSIEEEKYSQNLRKDSDKQNLASVHDEGSVTKTVGSNNNIPNTNLVKKSHKAHKSMTENSLPDRSDGERRNSKRQGLLFVLGQYIQNTNTNTYSEYEKYDKIKAKTKADLAKLELEKKQSDPKDTNQITFGTQGLEMISTLFIKKDLCPKPKTPVPDVKTPTK